MYVGTYIAYDYNSSLNRVCYLAGKFADHLKKVIEEDEILKNEIEITPDEILCIKIAGLCHDLGKKLYL